MMVENKINIDSILAMHFAGERLTGEQVNMLSQWVVSHKAEYDQLSKLWAQTARLSDAKLMEFDSADAWKRLQPKLKKGNGERLSFKLNHFQSFIASAACILVLLGFFFMRNSAEGDVQMYANTGNELNTIVLPDSSWVMMYPNSQLRYLTNQGTNHERRVALSGKAFFKVRRQLKQSFIVESANTEIKVLGTSFMVANEKDSPNTDVYVREGKVQVSTTTANVYLKANEQASVKGKSITKMEIAEPDIIFKDQIKHLKYNNSAIQEIINDITEEFGVEIIMDEHLRTSRISTELDFVNLEDILKELSYLCNCKYQKITDKKYKIYIP